MLIVTSPSAFASQVWTNASRSLTADPASPSAFAAAPNIAVATVLDLRPAAGNFREVFLVNTTQNQVLARGTYDGTTALMANSASAADEVILFGGSSTGPAVKNNAGVLQNVVYAGIDRI